MIKLVDNLKRMNVSSIKVCCQKREENHGVKANARATFSPSGLC